ncbi:hypothetical protein BJ166DRAFT_503757 [Pestalotiopsis sp. NC0098]|nr:hypothetical protein BJ166DRAFT_503757 [Pestalotiopsis sp. NC0098]
MSTMSPQSANTEVASPRPLTSLPVEIIAKIFSNLVPDVLPTDFKDREEYDDEENGWRVPAVEDAAGRDALRNLCQVSKTCHAIAGPLLYRNITISTTAQAFQLFFGMLMNDMGRHTRNFAFILLDDAVGEYSDPATLDAYEMCLTDYDLRRKVEKRHAYLFSDGIDEEEIMSPHFLSHVVMLSVGMMPRGEDVFLSLPRPNDTRFPPIEGVDLPDMSSQDMQPVGPWKSVRLQAHTTFSRGTRDADFLLLPFAAKATRIEIYDEYWHCQGMRKVIERGELERTNVQQFEEINLHIGATGLAWLPTLLEASLKLKTLTLGFSYFGGAIPDRELDSVLSPAKGKLESLNMYMIERPGFNLPAMASLSSFSSLKHLAIDLPLLWGLAFVDNPKKAPKISRMLPQSIQTLTLRERMYNGVMAEIFKNKNVSLTYNKWMAESVVQLWRDCHVGDLPKLRKLHLNLYDSYKFSRRFPEEKMIALRGLFQTAGVSLHWSWYHDKSLHQQKRFRTPNKWTNKPVKKVWYNHEFRPDDVCDCC